MSTLFMVNIPHNCTEWDLQHWVEGSGVEVKSVRMIRDLVSGASPSFAYVQISENIMLNDAIERLDGLTLGSRKIAVSEALLHQAAA